MKKIEFRFKLHWNMFPGIQLTISQHGFRRWLGAEQATSHYLDQWSPSLLTHICGTRGRWDKRMSTEITLKQKCRHFDEIFITGCTESCQNDNFRCSQWLKFHQNDNISVSVNGSAILVHIGFGNDRQPDNSKPLPKPKKVQMNISHGMICGRKTVTKVLENYHFEITFTIHMNQ